MFKVPAVQWNVRANSYPQWILLAVGIGVLFFLGGKSSQILSFLLHQSKGYVFLSNAVASIDEESFGSDYCFMDGILNEESIEFVESAKQELNSANQVRPKDSQNLLLLARSECISGNHEAAIKNYLLYTQLRPNNPLGFLELGYAYDVNGQKELAVQAWERGDATEHDFFKLGLNLGEENKFEEAIKWYQRSILINPKWAMPYIKVGLINVSLEEWELAIDYLHKGLQLDNNDQYAWYQIGMAYEKMAMWDEAFTAYQSALVHEGEIGKSNIYFRLGWINQYHFPEEQYVISMDFYQEALRNDEYHTNPFQKSNTLYHLGNLLSKQNRLTEAVESYLDSLELNPEHFWAHIQLSKVYWRSGNIELAITEAQKAVTFIHPIKR
ncbi:MAG: tetratricopeptide repeat protein [Anaerolineae bacterium]|nr:tetratricopeptide repeat protein [Anaerolineae bacterium]